MKKPLEKPKKPLEKTKKPLETQKAVGKNKKPLNLAVDSRYPTPPTPVGWVVYPRWVGGLRPLIQKMGIGVGKSVNLPPLAQKSKFHVFFKKRKKTTWTAILRAAASFTRYFDQNHSWFLSKAANRTLKFIKHKHENTGAGHIFKRRYTL